MNKSGWSRLAPLTGVVGVVLFVLGATLAGAGSYLPSVDQALAILNNGGGGASLAIYLGTLSPIFLIWFAGSLRSALRQGEGGTGRLSAVAFGGGLAASLAVAVAFAVRSAALGRAGAAGGISAEGAITSLDLWGSLIGETLPVSLGVLTAASGVASIRTGAFPAWLGWFGIVAALASVSPVGYVGQVVALIWIVVVSVWLFVREGSAMGQAAAGASEGLT